MDESGVFNCGEENNKIKENRFRKFINSANCIDTIANPIRSPGSRSKVENTSFVAEALDDLDQIQFDVVVVPRKELLLSLRESHAHTPFYSF